MQAQRSAPSERQCASMLRRARWPHGPACPYCSSDDVARSGRHLGVYRRYKCKSCARIFNDRTGTIFQDSRLPLKVWFRVALLQRRMSIRAVSKALGMYYNTTHKMVSKLRKSAYPDFIAISLSGTRAASEMRDSRPAEPLVLQVPRGRKTTA